MRSIVTALALVAALAVVAPAGARVHRAADAPQNCVRWGPQLAIYMRPHGLAVLFRATCPYGWAHAQFSWEFGEPGSVDVAVGPIASHAYTSRGRHRVVLTVVDPTFHLQHVSAIVVVTG